MWRWATKSTNQPITQLLWTDFGHIEWHQPPKRKQAQRYLHLSTVIHLCVSLTRYCIFWQGRIHQGSVSIDASSTATLESRRTSVQVTAPVPKAPVEDDQETVLDISGRSPVHVTAPVPKAHVEDDQETVLGISGRTPVHVTAPVPKAHVEDDQETVLGISGRTSVHVTAPVPKAPVEDDQETVLDISGRIPSMLPHLFPRHM